MGFGPCAPLGPYDSGYDDAQRALESETEPKTEAEKLADARKAAHEALDAAEKTWYAYAAMIDVGPDRVHAFDVYDHLRQARRL